jgi:hypothetical protein
VPILVDTGVLIVAIDFSYADRAAAGWNFVSNCAGEKMSAAKALIVTI